MRKKKPVVVGLHVAVYTTRSPGVALVVAAEVEKDLPPDPLKVWGKWEMSFERLKRVVAYDARRLRRMLQADVAWIGRPKVEGFRLKIIKRAKRSHKKISLADRSGPPQR